MRFVKIVGMRFYSGALEAIRAASHLPTFEEQCLYLVPVYNDHQHSVMLHNGKIKLGVVCEEQSKQIYDMLKSWQTSEQDMDVIVCQTWYIDREDPKDLNVRGIVRVNERLARKFSALQRKEI